MNTYTTTAAYLSGGLCGAIWWPVGEVCGKPVKSNLRGPWSFMPEGEGYSFRDALLSYLTSEGGDFQNAQFTSDSVLRIERRCRDGNGYRVHVWEREIAALPDCADLVNAEAYTGDFLGDDD